MTDDRIAHLTSVHKRSDVRIFFKQCQSLSKKYRDVVLVVADGLGDSIVRDVNIVDVGLPVSRIDRVLSTTRTIYKKAVVIDADIYHIHDPELLPLGLLLKRRGKKVIFDSHEDVSKDILTKTYIPSFARKVISKIYGSFEHYVCRQLDGVIAATPYIRGKFKDAGVYSVDVNNYPKLEEFAIKKDFEPTKKSQVVYVGGLTPDRGFYELVRAMELVQTESILIVGGKFVKSDFEAEVEAEIGWKKVKYLGWLNREAVNEALSESVAGLVTLHPIANYLDSLPVKMFEYMAAGLPVISSNFPLWKGIIEGNQCGICVDPRDSKAIAQAIDYLINHPDEAAEMGEKGQRAVVDRFNWNSEEKKLISFYESLK